MPFKQDETVLRVSPKYLQLSLLLIVCSFLIRQGIDQLAEYVGLIFPLFGSFQALEMGQDDDSGMIHYWIIYWIVYMLSQVIFHFILDPLFGM